MGCCMSNNKRNANDTGGTSVSNTDPSDDGTVPYWSSPGLASPSNTASNKTGGPYAGTSSDKFIPKNTGGKCDSSLGAMSASHESNGDPGIVAKDNIGYSYGMYQFNSTRGSVSKFMDYLSVNSPDTYSRLSSAGSIDSSSFMNAWKNEAQTNSDFKDLQGCYIKQLYFDKTVSNMKARYGVDITQYPLPVQQGIWSTAVQFGSNSSIFDKTFSNLPDNASSEDVVNRLTDAKLQTNSDGSLTYFQKSSSAIQRAVAKRFVTERSQMLSGLKSL